MTAGAAAAAQAGTREAGSFDPGAGLITRLALDPATIEQDLGRLVLTLVELVRRLMEGQALRRMETGTLTAEEAERLGLGLMHLRGAVETLCGRLGLRPEELNLDLGPLGRLL